MQRSPDFIIFIVLPCRHAKEALTVFALQERALQVPNPGMGNEGLLHRFRDADAGLVELGTDIERWEARLHLDVKCIL